MIDFTTQIDIDRPPGEVFEFVANFENTPKWNYFVIDVQKRTTSPTGIGTVFHQIRKTDEQDYQVTALDPGRSIEVKTTPGSRPSFTIRYQFDAMDAGTRLSDHWQLQSGHNALLERLGTHRIRAAVTENLEKLKELLETGTTQLQDGRISNLR